MKKGVDIRELFLSLEDDGSNDYKSGWNDAVCWINDMFNIESRDGTPIQISFDISIDEDRLIEKILEKKDAGK